MYNWDTPSGMVEPAPAPPSRIASGGPLDNWISEARWDHFTLPMSLQCRLFPWTTLRVQFPRKPKKEKTNG